MLAIAITHKLPNQSATSMQEQIELQREGLVWIGTSVRGLSREQMKGMAGDPLRDTAVLEDAGAEGAVAIVRYELFGDEKRLAVIPPREPEVRNGLHCLHLAEHKVIVLPAESLKGINTKGRAIWKLEGSEREEVLAEAKSRGLFD